MVSASLPIPKGVPKDIYGASSSSDRGFPQETAVTRLDARMETTYPAETTMDHVADAVRPLVDSSSQYGDEIWDKEEFQEAVQESFNTNDSGPTATL